GAALLLRLARLDDSLPVAVILLAGEDELVDEFALLVRVSADLFGEPLQIRVEPLDRVIDVVEPRGEAAEGIIVDEDVGEIARHAAEPALQGPVHVVGEPIAGEATVVAEPEGEILADGGQAPVEGALKLLAVVVAVLLAECGDLATDAAGVSGDSRAIEVGEKLYPTDSLRHDGLPRAPWTASHSPTSAGI